MEKLRLSKLMSQRGMCSRREADVFIERGWVFVDGVRVGELGMKVFPDQEVKLDRLAKQAQEDLLTVILHKPVGYVSGQPEDGKVSAITLITPENRFGGTSAFEKRRPGRLPKGFAPAGRLDIDSSGLIVYTQDGRLAKQLIGEASDIEKEYLVRVEGNLSDEGLELLKHGLSLDGRKLKRAKVYRQNEDQLLFILKEGRKRQIRLMCEQVGLKVTGLKRVRIGNVMLGKLPSGRWRYVGPDETF
jgi:23S rRNA pseudouridine2604 synthase